MRGQRAKIIFCTVERAVPGLVNSNQRSMFARTVWFGMVGSGSGVPLASRDHRRA